MASARPLLAADAEEIGGSATDSDGPRRLRPAGGKLGSSKPSACHLADTCFLTAGGDARARGAAAAATAAAAAATATTATAAAAAAAAPANRGDHSHDHDHDKRDHDKQPAVTTRLMWATALCTVFMLVELVGGYLASSVAIMSDAAHLLSDVSAFLVSIAASYAVAQRPAPAGQGGSYSYGFHRTEVLAALVSALMIWAVTGALVWEAVQRVIRPVPVDGRLMFAVSVAAVLFNVCIALVLGAHGGHLHSHGHGGHGHGGGCGGHGHGSHGHSHAAPLLEDGHAHEHGDDSHDHDHDHNHDHEHGHDEECGGGNGHSHSHDHHDHAHGHGHGNGGTSGSAQRPQQQQKKKQKKSQQEQQDSLALRGAVLHVIGDLLQSVGVALAGLLIWRYGDTHPAVYYADPCCTFLFSILVLLSTKGILADVFHVLMERAPADVDMAEVEEGMNREIAAAVAAAAAAASSSSAASLQRSSSASAARSYLHDLHVWSLSTGLSVLTAHVHVPAGVDARRVVARLEAFLRGKGLTHTTIQTCAMDEGEEDEEEEDGEEGEEAGAGEGSAHDHAHDHGHHHDHAHCQGGHGH